MDKQTVHPMHQTDSAPLFQSKWSHQHPFLHYLPARSSCWQRYPSSRVFCEDSRWCPKSLLRACNWATSYFDLSKLWESCRFGAPKRNNFCLESMRFCLSTSIMPTCWTAIWHANVSVSMFRPWTFKWSRSCRDCWIADELSDAQKLLIMSARDRDNSCLKYSTSFLLAHPVGLGLFLLNFWQVALNILMVLLKMLAASPSMPLNCCRLSKLHLWVFQCMM